MKRSMKKQPALVRGRKGRDEFQAEFTEEAPQRPVRRTLEPLEAQTPRQEKYINAIKASTLTFGLGPAGTGKTYIAGRMAAQALLNKECEQIIITRPVVEAGESLGFLPGEKEEKFEPYIAAFREVLIECFGKTHFEYMLKNGKIRAEPLAYMRGLTFKDAFVVLDEAQNTTPAQMKLFLTRIGRNSKVVVNGDLDQMDIKGPSGLNEAVKRISFIPAVRVVRFDERDIVRSDLVQEIVTSWNKYTPEVTPQA